MTRDTRRSELRDKKIRRVLLFIAALSIIWCFLGPLASASDKWQGVDESVVERVAKEHGREVAKPLINIGQGDLLLFVFLLAGAVGGFGAGYYWRMLTERKAKTADGR